MSTVKQMMSLYRQIIYKYENQEIAYPRVANNYIELSNLKFYEYPHPPLHTFDNYSKPLANESYLLDKKTLPLYLTNSSIATPATLTKSMLFLDKFIDDMFELRSNINSLDLEQNLDILMQKIKEDAIIVYSGDIKNDIRKNDLDIDKLKEEELLHICSPNGEILKSFKMEITPYSIMFNESDYTKSVENNNDEKDDIIVNNDKKIVFKIASNPIANFPKDDTQKSIKVRNIKHLLQVDEYAKTISNMQQSVEESKKLQDELDNSRVARVKI